MTVYQLLHSMDARELAEWAAYFSLEAGEDDGTGARPRRRQQTPEEMRAELMKLPGVRVVPKV